MKERKSQITPAHVNLPQSIDTNCLSVCVCLYVLQILLVPLDKRNKPPKLSFDFFPSHYAAAGCCWDAIVAHRTTSSSAPTGWDGERNKKPASKWGGNQIWNSIERASREQHRCGHVAERTNERSCCFHRACREKIDEKAISACSHSYC